MTIGLDLTKPGWYYFPTSHLGRPCVAYWDGAGHSSLWIVPAEVAA